MSLNCLFAGWNISLTFLFPFRELITELSMGFRERETEKGETQERRIMIITEGQGVGGHVGDEFSLSLFIFFFNDGLKWC